MKLKSKPTHAFFKNNPNHPMDQIYKIYEYYPNMNRIGLLVNDEWPEFFVLSDVIMLCMKGGKFENFS